MKRRNFLKLLGISPIVPSVLMAKEKNVLSKFFPVPMRLPKEKWFSLSLNIESESIPGAEVWIGDCNNIVWNVWQNGEYINGGTLPQDYNWHTFTMLNEDGTTSTGCF